MWPWASFQTCTFTQKGVNTVYVIRLLGILDSLMKVNPKCSITEDLSLSLPLFPNNVVGLSFLFDKGPCSGTLPDHMKQVGQVVATLQNDDLIYKRIHQFF